MYHGLPLLVLQNLDGVREIRFGLTADIIRHLTGLDTNPNQHQEHSGDDYHFAYHSVIHGLPLDCVSFVSDYL